MSFVKIDRLHIFFLTLAIITSLSALFYSVIYLRSYSSEASMWALNILNTGEFILHEPHFRWFTALLQIPMLIIVNYFPISELFLSLANFSFAFSYTFHPILSLAICFFILRSKEKIDLLVFPLLSFALVTHIGLFTTINSAIESISIFWPLFFLIYLAEKNKEKILFISLLLIALMLSYEVSILYFVFLSLVILFNKRAQEIVTQKRLVILSLMLTGIIWFLWILFSAPSEADQFRFWDSLFMSSYLYQKSNAIVSLLIILYITLIFYFRNKYIGPLSVFLVSLIIIASFYPLLIESFPYFNLLKYQADSYNSRALAIPKTIFIAILLILYNQYVVKKKELLHFLILCLSIVLIRNSFFDFLTTNLITEGKKEILFYKDKNNVCKTLNDKELLNLSKYSFRSYSLPATSILAQNRRKINFVVFHISDSISSKMISLDPCQSREYHRIVYPYNDLFFTLNFPRESKFPLINYDLLKKNIPHPTIPIFTNKQQVIESSFPIYNQGYLISKNYDFDKNIMYTLEVKAEKITLNKERKVFITCYLETDNEIIRLDKKELSNDSSYIFRYKSDQNIKAKVLIYISAIPENSFSMVSKISHILITKD